MGLNWFVGVPIIRVSAKLEMLGLLARCQRCGMGWSGTAGVSAGGPCGSVGGATARGFQLELPPGGMETNVERSAVVHLAEQQRQDIGPGPGESSVSSISRPSALATSISAGAYPPRRSPRSIRSRSCARATWPSARESGPPRRACHINSNFWVSTILEDFNGRNPTLRLSPYAQIMFDDKAGKIIVEAVHVSSPFNLLPNLIAGVIESDLSGAKILTPVGVYRQRGAGRDADVFPIPCVIICA